MLFYSKRNLTSSAIGLLEKAVALDKSLIEAQSKLASLYSSVGRLHDAEIIYKRLISINNQDADLANHYGIFLEHIGKSIQSVD